MERESLLGTLAHWVREQPNKRLFTFVNDDGQEIHTLTYQELDNCTSALAEHLSGGNAQPGDRVLLVFFPSLDFIIAFFACLKAGLIAVPVFPPDPRRLKKDLYMFVSITASSGARIALTHSSYNFSKKVADISSIFAKSDSESLNWPDLTWIVIDNILSSPSTFTPHQSPPSSIAFLQYTSGSTSEPKGVMISHSNLSHNLSIIVSALHASTSTIVVSWLPQYHDMGLIGSYLGIVACGGSGVYMSPFSFIKNPVLWLDMISRYHGTHIQAPNFAYSLVTRKFKSAKRSFTSLDLSSIQHMINAAEPIDIDTINGFYETFTHCGLSQGSMYPTYGLAEHTVFVCSNGSQVIRVNREEFEFKQAILLDDNSNSNLIMIGCGRPGNIHVEIVSDDGYRLDDDLVGEVYVNSLSKAMGYYGLDDVTRRDFHAKIINDDSEEGYLKTGDLGFIHNGELFICGRIKDMMIVGGRNYYPQDVERTVERLSPLIRQGCLACFSMPFSSKDELVILVSEIRTDNVTQQTDLPILSDLIKSTIARDHGLSLSAIILISPHSIHKTSSGKIARSWIRKAYVKGDLKPLYLWTRDLDNNNHHDDTNSDVIIRTRAEVELMSLADLLTEVSNLLTLQHVTASSTSVSLISMGLDSMSIAQIKGMIDVRYKADLPNEYYFSELCTLDHLTQAISNGQLNDDDMKAIGEDGEQKMNDVVEVKQPMCPWFTCCY